jgi:hypothetical protein
MEPFIRIGLAEIEPRGESFPLQDQAKSPVRIGTGRPAAGILAERAAGVVAGIPPDPLFRNGSAAMYPIAFHPP